MVRIFAQHHLHRQVIGSFFKTGTIIIVHCAIDDCLFAFSSKVDHLAGVSTVW